MPDLTTGRAAMTKVSANTSNLSVADSPELRSKRIREKLRQQRSVRDGVVLGASYASQMPRRFGESTLDRNQRIIVRYHELLKQNGGKARGIPVRLGQEFKLSPQYVRGSVIKPFLHTKAAIKHR